LKKFQTSSNWSLCWDLRRHCLSCGHGLWPSFFRLSCSRWIHAAEFINYFHRPI